MKKKVGIIGFGRMGQIRFEVIKKLDIFEVVSIYDPYSTKKNKLFVNSIDDLFNNKNIEIIFICTPNYLNKKLTIESLKKEKHVFCEKPPGLNAKDIENVIIAENKYKKTLMYGFNHRHHDSIQKIKQIVDEKEFGRILWMRGRYGKSVETDFYKNWRSKKEYSGGGILIDQGIHMLDIFLYLAGDFDKIQATVSNLYWDLDIEDNVFAVLQNSKNKIAASLHSTMTQWRNLFSLEVFFEKGYVVLNGLNTSSKSYGEEVLNIAKNRSSAPTAIWEEEENIHFKIDNSWEKEIIACGISVSMPTGMEAQIRPRSGLAAKSNISVLNTPGTIDSDYRGEIKIILFNHSNNEFIVSNNDRIAQMVLMPVLKVEFEANCKPRSNPESNASIAFAPKGILIPANVEMLNSSCLINLESISMKLSS